MALALATMLHAAPLIWIATRLPDSMPGAGGASLEAISVDMIDASALEAMRARVDAQGGSAGGSAQEAAAASIAQEEIAAAAPPPREAALPDPREEARQGPTEADASELAAARKQQTSETPGEQPKEAQETAREARAAAAADKAAAAAPQDAHVASAAAAAAALTAEERVTSEGAASASSGENARYALEVRLALGKVRPRHLGSRGRVVVEFALSDTGSLTSAGIARSSGVPAIDEAALSAVRGTVFPAPPPGLTAAQRRYAVPFMFR